MSSDHMHIARERFLELMAIDDADAKYAAAKAIQDADEFMNAYSILVSRDIPNGFESVKLKGCRACHGSGGKSKDPCKACNGTGKVRE